MIHKISQDIAELYGSKVGYTKDEIEVCTYGMELVISDAIAIIALMIAAIIMNMVAYTLILLLSFIVLRHQAGGFHASSHMRCNILFFGGYAVSIALAAFVPIHIIRFLIYAFDIVSIAGIIRYAPAEHPNRHVSKTKKKKFRRNSLIITCILTAISVLQSVYDIAVFYGLGVALGMFFVGLSVMAETIKQSKQSVSADL